MDGLNDLIIVHACGHGQTHPVPEKLSEDSRTRVTVILSQERCWRCITQEAWARLPPWSSPVKPALAPKQPPGREKQPRLEAPLLLCWWCS